MPLWAIVASYFSSTFLHFSSQSDIYFLYIGAPTFFSNAEWTRHSFYVFGPVVADSLHMAASLLLCQNFLPPAHHAAACVFSHEFTPALHTLSKHCFRLSHRIVRPRTCSTSNKEGMRMKKLHILRSTIESKNCHTCQQQHDQIPRQTGKLTNARHNNETSNVRWHLSSIEAHLQTRLWARWPWQASMNNKNYFRSQTVFLSSSYLSHKIASVTLHFPSALKLCSLKEPYQLPLPRPSDAQHNPGKHRIKQVVESKY